MGAASRSGIASGPRVGVEVGVGVVVGTRRGERTNDGDQVSTPGSLDRCVVVVVEGGTVAGVIVGESSRARVQQGTGELEQPAGSDGMLRARAGGRRGGGEWAERGLVRF